MNLKIESTKFVDIADVVIPDIYYRRMKTGVEELDALFGDGILPGSSMTISARAGLGKTTLVLQILKALSKNNFNVGYCSNEESVEQLAMTCKRLNINNIKVCNEASIDNISKYMDYHDVIVVDSFQGLAKNGMSGRKLEKYCIEKLVKRAKETECAVILICHNTKTGVIKGSSLILHAVDVNISIERIKDADINFRKIVFHKNRFGPASELECLIRVDGYDFTAEMPDEALDSTTKANKKKDQRNVILQLKEPLTVATVCRALNIDSTRANYLLRELQMEGKLYKKGRGADSLWLFCEEEIVEELAIEAKI